MHSNRDEEASAVLRGLRHLVHRLRISAHSVEQDVGLTGAQLFVLGELAAEPHVSIRRIAERTLTDPSSASVVVARLLERGLVRRRQDPADRRRSVLSVTPQGQSVLDRAPEPYQVKLFAALHALPRQRLHQLHLGLSALLEASSQTQGAVPFFFEGAPHPGARGKGRAGSS